MSAFVISGRIGMTNKGRVEYLIQFLKNNMMNQSVFNLGFMNDSMFGVVNMEFNIGVVFVG